MYHLELYDKTNTNRQGYLIKLSEPNVYYEIEGSHSLNFRLAFEDEYYNSVLEKMYIRVVEDNNDSNYNSFIIQSINTRVDGGKNVYKIIQCEGLKYALMENILQYKKKYVDITCTTALTEALSGSGFTVGTVNAASSNLNTVEFNWVNSLEALQIIIDTWYYDISGIKYKFYYKVNEDKTVDILTEANLGTANNFYVHVEKNLKAISRDSDAKDMSNRVYGIGADGFTFIRANRVNYEYNAVDSTATDGAVNYLEDTVNILTDDLHNGMKIAIDSGAASGDRRTVLDTNGTTNRLIPTVNFSAAISAGDQYRVGIVEKDDTITYELGLPDANTDSVGMFTNIVVNYSLDMVATTGSGSAIFKVRCLDQSNNIVASGANKHLFPDFSADNSTSGQVKIYVGEISNIRKLQFNLTTIGTGASVSVLFLTQILYTLAPNDIFIDDATSQATYGIVSGKYVNENIYDTYNMFKNATFSGTYTAGLCEDWILVGNPTVSENLNSDYIYHGTKSQKISCSTDGEGIEQRIAIETGISYSLYVRVYIDPVSDGSVLITANPEFPAEGNTFYIIQGAGWIETTIENFAYMNSTYVNVRLLSSGDAVDFYADSIMMHEGAEIEPFVNGDSADLLYNETLAHLHKVRNPRLIYNLDMVHLFEINPYIYRQENFNIGDLIRLVDEDINVDDQFLVVSKAYNPLLPAACAVTLSNKPDRFRRGLQIAINESQRQKRSL